MQLEEISVPGYKRVVRFEDSTCGLRGFLSIHDTTLGPALGGTRIWHYPSDSPALEDVLRLSRAMTYKAALAELPCGGGKAVIFSHPGLQREAAFTAYGHLVESLEGQFFTGPDVGVTETDLEIMKTTTRFVAVHSDPGLGDLNQMTAQGVWYGMRACLDFTGLEKPRVVIQGLGHVGMALARILAADGFGLAVADIDALRAAEARKNFDATVIDPAIALSTDCTVLAPCALGGVIQRSNSNAIRARIICGSANNILASLEAGDDLAQRDILYAPDYLVNAGGLIRGAEFQLLKKPDSHVSIGSIYDRTMQVLTLAKHRAVSPARIADELAEARLRQGHSSGASVS